MTDWMTTSSSLATAAGTLVLAAATFAAVRSSNRSARATERALLAGIRPVLMPSRLQDPAVKVGFMDDHWIKLDGGRAAADVTDDVIYLAMAIRNAGTGVAVLDRWDLCTEAMSGDAMHGDPAGFHRLTRDIFLSGGDFGFWQGALRDSADNQFEDARAAIEERRRITIDLLYGDLEGGQRTVSRFVILPAGDGGWVVVVARHWNLDRPDPR
jgi:hypothetical protein